MPATPSGIAALIVPNLASVTLVGSDTPKIATGVGIGVSNWLSQMSIQTIDSGTLGVGSGGPMPLVVPPTLLVNMLVAFVASGMLGPSAPLLATGISNGLLLAFPQALIKTTHIGVGSGTGVAKFFAPPATPIISLGLAQGGVVGPLAVQLANGVGAALDVTFATLVVSVPIIGPPSPSGGSGTGFGKII